MTDYENTQEHLRKMLSKCGFSPLPVQKMTKSAKVNKKNKPKRIDDRMDEKNNDGELFIQIKKNNFL